MSKKRNIEKGFIYRHRFVLGYIMLGLAFLGLIFALPLLSPAGLSEEEMTSTISSNTLTSHSIIKGDLINLPYRIIQKTIIHFFGLNIYTVKLPSIIFSIFLAIFLILLLNRWFKSNVALVTSILITLSVPFLYLAGIGTPDIMFVLFPTIILWLGSKIHNNPKPNPLLFVALSFVMLLSSTVPHLIFLIIAIVFYSLLNPHIRFSVFRLPILPKLIVFTNFTLVLAVLILIFLRESAAFLSFLFHESPSFSRFNYNVSQGLTPFFAWNSVAYNSLLSPLVGLPVFAIIITGFIANIKKFFSSRLALSTLLIIFGVIMTGIKQKNALFLLIPISILLAYGIEYIFMRWYSIFPENPYARLFAIIPISILLGVIISGNFSHFVYGYRYTPIVANYFNDDLRLILKHVEPETPLLIPAGSIQYDFYKIIPKHKVTSNTPDAKQIKKVAVLRSWSEKLPKEFRLEKIITSSKLRDSDRIYIYTVKD